MAPEHPGELSERFEATMSFLPEPALQILYCIVLASVIPQSSEHIFAEVCPYDFEIALEKASESVIFWFSVRFQGFFNHMYLVRLRASQSFSANALVLRVSFL